MFTRKQYQSNECTHRQYYGQFVTDDVRRTVERWIGADDINKSTDPHFNDIPLSRWDAVFFKCPANINTKMRELGDWPTLAGLCCIAKEAAKQIKEA